MSLHGLLSVTIGVPNVEETAAYYTDFGLAPAAGGWFSTVDGGPQLRIVPAPSRRLVELHVAADNTDDLGRAATNLALLGLGRQLCRSFLAAAETVFAELMTSVREVGVAALIATHNPDLANRMDRMIGIQDGRIVEYR